MNRREAAEPGCCGTKAARVQQPQRRAVRLNLDQSPAPQRLRTRAERQTRQLFPGEFVLHTLRHTMLTRLGESGVDAFTIMKIAGHSSIVVSQRYVHPTPEALERAFESLQRTNRGKEANAEISDAPTQAPATSDVAIFVSN